MYLIDDSHYKVLYPSTFNPSFYKTNRGLNIGSMINYKHWGAFVDASYQGAFKYSYLTTNKTPEKYNTLARVNAIRGGNQFKMENLLDIDLMEVNRFELLSPDMVNHRLYRKHLNNDLFYDGLRKFELEKTELKKRIAKMIVSLLIPFETLKLDKQRSKSEFVNITV